MMAVMSQCRNEGMKSTRYAVYDLAQISEAWERGEARRRGAQGTLWIQGWYTPREAGGARYAGHGCNGRCMAGLVSTLAWRHGWRGSAYCSRAGRRRCDVYHLVPSSPLLSAPAPVYLVVPALVSRRARCMSSCSVQCMCDSAWQAELIHILNGSPPTRTSQPSLSLAPTDPKASTPHRAKQNSISHAFTTAAAHPPARHQVAPAPRVRCTAAPSPPPPPCRAKAQQDRAR